MKPLNVCHLKTIWVVNPPKLSQNILWSFEPICNNWQDWLAADCFGKNRGTLMVYFGLIVGLDVRKGMLRGKNRCIQGREMVVKLFLFGIKCCTIQKNSFLKRDPCFFAGEYSCLKVELIFKREFSYYLITIYVPCCMLVIVSWVSFWLDQNAIPARVSLGVTTLLTMSTQTSGDKQLIQRIFTQSQLHLIKSKKSVRLEV